jgi:hypothetical protein
MRQRQRRAGDAERNVSRWESLLSDARSLFSRSKQLIEDVSETRDDIDRAWDDTSREIATTRNEVSDLLSEQADDRTADASFDERPAAEPPAAVDDVDPVHGAVDLPSDLDYRVPDPVDVERIREELGDIEDLPARERERPAPYTEREWFKLHSDQFPISEDVFAVDPAERLAETTEDDAGRRIREPSERRDRETDREEER